MIFNEMYSAYYNTVAAVLKEATAHPVSDSGIREIVEKYAFGESYAAIFGALKEQRWTLLRTDGTTPIQHSPSIPLSLLEKRWLKAVACDPRIRLFGETGLDFPEVEPLFLPSDVIVFDQYADGDPYTDETYGTCFRLILEAIRKNCLLDIELPNRKGEVIRKTILPHYLEYSQKDDKFRLIGESYRKESTINLGRILSCKMRDTPMKKEKRQHRPVPQQSVTFEVRDERKALERVLLHFAHFEKTAEKIDETRYAVTVRYSEEDETEIVIRILSFGCLVKVTAPEHFVEQMKKRLIAQKSCGL